MSNRAHYQAEREAAMIRDGYACQHCGKPATQAAHMIPDRKMLIRVYGRKVIDSRHNLRAACGLACNAALQGRSSGPVELARMVAEIESKIDRDAGK